MSNRLAIIIYPRVNDYSSRIIKESHFLINESIVDKVLILSMHYDDKLDFEFNESPKIKIKRIITKAHRLPKNAIGDIIKFKEFTIKCKKIISKLSPTIVSPHSVSVLPIGTWAKRKKHCVLIYDAHELETERYKLKGIRQKIAQFLEQKHIRKCDKVVVVNETIANWYKQKYNITNVFYVENIPLNPYEGKIMQASDKLRIDLNIPSDKIIFIYQGILSLGRGVSELVEIFKSGKVYKDRVIVFMGYGEFENEIKQVSSNNEQVYFKSAVKQDQILEYTSGADVGLFYILDKNLCLSYKMSLPNKFYEYSIAGLYISVNDYFSVMPNIIKKNKLGNVVKTDIKEMILFFNSITKDKIKESKEKSSEYRRKIDWSQNYSTLKEVYTI